MIGVAAETTCFILDMHQVDGLSDNAARLLNDARLSFAGDDIAVVFSRIHARPAIEGLLNTTAPKGDRGFLSFEDNLKVDDINRLAGDSPQLKIALLENVSPGMAESLKRATQWIGALA